MVFNIGTGCRSKGVACAGNLLAVMLLLRVVVGYYVAASGTLAVYFGGQCSCPGQGERLPQQPLI